MLRGQPKDLETAIVERGKGGVESGARKCEVDKTWPNSLDLEALSETFTYL